MLVGCSRRWNGRKIVQNRVQCVAAWAGDYCRHAVGEGIAVSRDRVEPTPKVDKRTDRNVKFGARRVVKEGSPPSLADGRKIVFETDIAVFRDR